MTAPITFAGNPLDRCSEERRREGWLETQTALEATRFLPFWKLQPLVKLESPRSLAWATRDFFSDVDPTPDLVLLGQLDGVAHFAVDVSAVPEKAEAVLGVEGVASFDDLRAVAPQLDAQESGMAAQARSLLSWHEHHRWCSACGGSTRMRFGGELRSCGDCLTEHFPRTDPVAIAVVSDGDRCLLGRGKGWPAPMYSALAGFIEPGETLEGALRREVLEEAGIRVGEVRYLQSQPWPFPSSLMIGCIAEALSSEIRVDETELADAAWFTRDVVREALAGRSRDLVVPPSMALAHHLIRSWAERDA